MKKILIVISFIFLAGCGQSFDIQLEPEVTVYFSDDDTQNVRLTSQDEEYVALNEWLRNNRSSWLPTSGRYPGGVYLTSGQYGIQITKTHVILYSTTLPEPQAIYIQTAARDELGAIRNLAK